jgi:ubiquinone/menaquinone biosynthesis C-methylase UbiE
VASEEVPAGGPEAAARLEAEYFDGLVRQRGEFNPFTDRGWETLGRCFREMLARAGLAAPGRRLRLLDVGCGTGESRRIYAAHAGSYLGIDVSLTALRLALLRSSPAAAGRGSPADRSAPAAPAAPAALPRQAGQGVGWVRADARRLPVPDRSFDVVCLSSVLHHVPDRGAAIAEALRVLVPGGWSFAFDPNLLHPAMALFRHPASPLYTSRGVSPNERPLLGRDLRRQFAAAGFVDVQQHAQSGIPYRAVAPRLLNAGLGLYNLGDRLLQRSGLGRWFGAFVVTYGRRGPSRSGA